ncbi:MAG: recombination protein RecR [Chlorobi bacterium]|nr:recombination protein RecR [Chlorobiota bacterium]
MEYGSKLLEEVVNEIAALPGIGKRTALRLALHLLRQPESRALQLSDALRRFRTEIKRCRICHNISDTDTCAICANPARDHATVCVVEDIRDVMAIENTGQFRGVYHVLGGLISPMEGVSPEQLFIDDLVRRVEEENLREVILALSPTVEGDTTAYYIYKKLKDKPVSLTSIARGIGFGEEIEYADEITLARSIENRVPFDQSLKF